VNDSHQKTAAIDAATGQASTSIVASGRAPSRSPHDVHHPAASHDFWDASWAARRIGFHRSAPNDRLLAGFEPALAEARRGRILVPLCGKSVDLHWLARHFDEVVGVEFVETAALEFAAESALPHTDAPYRPGRTDSPRAITVTNVSRISILVSDFFAVTAAAVGHFDAAYDRAALIALPPTLRERYVAHLASLLAPGAPALIVTLDYPPHLRSNPPFPVADTDALTLFSAYGRVDRLSCDPTYEVPSDLPPGTPVTTSTFRFTRSHVPVEASA